MSKNKVFEKKNVFICGAILICFTFLFFYFVKALRYKKFYSLNHPSEYHIVHHFKLSFRENPIKISSKLRQDLLKKGVAEGVLKGGVKHLIGTMNGSIYYTSKAKPAVDESGIYIGADEGWFYKISPQGKLIWKTYFANTNPGGIQGTALLSDQYLWIGACNGVLYCLKKDTGEIVWATDLGLDSFIGSSPSFYKGLIIVSVAMCSLRDILTSGLPPSSVVIPNAPSVINGYIAGVSAKDGTLKWKKSSLPSSHIHLARDFKLCSY